MSVLIERIVLGMITKNSKEKIDQNAKRRRTMHNKQQIAKQKMEDIQKVSSTSGSSKDSGSSGKTFKKNK